MAIFYQSVYCTNSENWTEPSELNAIFSLLAVTMAVLSGCSCGHQEEHTAEAKTSGPERRICDFAVVQKKGRLLLMMVHLLFDKRRKP